VHVRDDVLHADWIDHPQLSAGVALDPSGAAEAGTFQKQLPIPGLCDLGLLGEALKLEGCLSQYHLF
jgi:hypothetical protein